MGGMCVDIAADDGTGVLLDLGMPPQAPDVAAIGVTHLYLDGSGRTTS